MAVNMLGLAFTFLMTLAYNRAMGQALTMLFAMVNESSDVLLIIVFLAFAFGVASMPLLPSLVGTLNTTLVHSVRRPPHPHAPAFCSRPCCAADVRARRSARSARRHERHHLRE
jgi:hypothetical protein